ncbi:major facilitator superfamily transporter [Xylariaceae sp. FL0662B]|nr:major facilitator superfamily transporter [Xylariaceae sp. FL0662B]
MVAMPASAVYSVVTPIRQATGLSLADINNGTGIMFLFYGWGCVIWQPLALQYGKRPVYLFSLVFNIIILATAPLCTTQGTYLANRILLGFLGAPVESLCEISIADIWFTHERPKYLAWYGWSLAMTGKLAPMLSGFINVGMGWEWTLRWCAIWIGIALVYCFFLMEETNYDRPANHSPASDTTNRSAKFPGDKDDDKTATTEVTIAEEGRKAKIVRKSYLQKLSIKDKPRPNRLLHSAVGCLKGFLYPSVVYGGLMYGANNLVWTGVQNATAGTVYTTMYGFSTAGVAAAYSGGVIGVCIGGYYVGKVGSMLTIRLARRNGGISEAEHTLWLFAASMILVPFSLLLYGLGVTYHIHWFGLVFSQTTLSVNSALCISAGLGYAISSYPELSGDMVTTCILIRNTLSFAINWGITPWLNAMGYRNTYIIVAAIGFVWNASMLVMVKIGRRLREKSASRYWKDVQRAREKGVSH